MASALFHSTNAIAEGYQSVPDIPPAVLISALLH